MLGKFSLVVLLTGALCADYAAFHGGLPLPDDLMIGASTAAYQIEGAWNKDGKGPNTWDDFTHRMPERIADRSSGDVACNSYEMYEEDVKLLKNVGMTFYRFSISWARVLPDGDVSSLNQAGVDYYNRLINKLLENNIEPMVTMFHWDLPQSFVPIGGLTNSVFVDYFEAYADLLFGLFGDRVKYWMTFNEPIGHCWDSYGQGTQPPNVIGHGTAEYLCINNVLKSHAKAYRLYRRKYLKSQKGKISITLNTNYPYPLDNSTTMGTEYTERSLQFQLGWLGHPIYKGDYPPVMRQRIDANSRREGRSRSRLPTLSSYWIKEIKGTADFFNFNYYTSRMVTELNDEEAKRDGWKIPSWYFDTHLQQTMSPRWQTSAANWLVSAPEGMGAILRWIKKEYNNPPVIISENGWADNGQLNDTDRVEYIKLHLTEVVKAIRNAGCNVKAYTVWSIIDNFEWLAGYSQRFGLYHVNFTSAGRERTPKLSAEFMRNVNLFRTVPAH